jgi:hypothetical protein
LLVVVEAVTHTSVQEVGTVDILRELQVQVVSMDVLSGVQLQLVVPMWEVWGTMERWVLAAWAYREVAVVAADTTAAAVHFYQVEAEDPASPTVQIYPLARV